MFWRYDLREVIEGGLTHFYFLTMGIGPALLGYACGRWMPAPVRVIPLLFILPAGYWWTINSDHWFESYVIGNFLYALFCMAGVRRRATDRGVPFWSLHHFDWITVFIATVVMMFVYVRPQA
jgi:hypothetical protein